MGHAVEEVLRPSILAAPDRQAGPQPSGRVADDKASDIVPRPAADQTICAGTGDGPPASARPKPPFPARGEGGLAEHTLPAGS